MIEIENTVIEETPIPLEKILRMYPSLITSGSVVTRKRYVVVSVAIDVPTYNLMNELSNKYNTTLSGIVEKIIELWRNQNSIPDELFMQEYRKTDRDKNKYISARIDIELYNFVRIVKLNLSRTVRFTIKEIIGNDELGRFSSPMLSNPEGSKSQRQRGRHDRYYK
jgi:hypothetical protein